MILITKADLDDIEEVLKKPYRTKTNYLCECGKGHLVVREGYDKFLGCSRYPNCKQTYKVAQRSSKSMARQQAQGLAHLSRELNKLSNLMDPPMSDEEREYWYGYGDADYWGTGGGIYCKDDM